MHYCVYLFTKDLPNDDEINRIMYPYDEYNPDCEKYKSDKNFTPDIWFDYLAIGGRYSGELKLKCSENSEVYEWYRLPSKPRAGRLFRCKLLEATLSRSKENSDFLWNSIEANFFKYSGLRDGYVHVDGCKISDLYNLEEVINSGGFVDDVFEKQSARELWDRSIGFLIDNREYENEMKAAFERNKDNYLTILDLHC